MEKKPWEVDWKAQGAAPTAPVVTPSVADNAYANPMSATPTAPDTAGKQPWEVDWKTQAKPLTYQENVGTDQQRTYLNNPTTGTEMYNVPIFGQIAQGVDQITALSGMGDRSKADSAPITDPNELPALANFPSQATQNVQDTPDAFVDVQQPDPSTAPGTFQRGLMGAGLNLAKETGGFAEWVLDSLSQGRNVQNPKDGSPMPAPVQMAKGVGETIHGSLKFADYLLHTDFGNDEQNWFEQNTPTMKPENPVEGFISSAGSTAAGMLMGAKGVEGAVEKAGGKSLMDWLGGAFMNMAQKTNPRNLVAKRAAFMKSLAIELGGANVGGTITTPGDQGSLTNNALDYFGQPELPNKVGQFVDNTVFSTAAAGVGAILGLTGKVAKAFGFGGPKQGSIEQTMPELFGHIDPMAKKLSKEELARRMQLFSDAVRDNATQDVRSAGKYEYMPVTAMLKGARQYIEGAYEFQKVHMSPQEWDQFVTDKSNLIVNNMNSLRAAMRSNPIVQAEEARISQTAGNVFKGAADNLATKQGVTDAGQQIAGYAQKDVQAAADTALPAQQAHVLAQGVNDAAQNTGPIMGPLRQAQKDDPYVVSTQPEKEQAFDLYGTGVRKGHEEAYTDVQTAFQAARENTTPVNEYDFATQLTRLGETDPKQQILNNILDVLGKRKRPAVPQTPSIDANGQAMGDAATATPTMEMAEGFKGLTLGTLYADVRPVLTKWINQLDKGALADANPNALTANMAQRSQLIELKKYIDELAATSNDPAMITAMEKYQDYENIYGNLNQMESLGDLGKQVVNSGSAEIKDEQFLLDGYQAYENAVNNPNDPKGLQLDAMIDAAQFGSDRPVSAETGDMLMALLLKRAAKGKGVGEDISAKDLAASLGTLEPALLKTNPKGLEQFRQAISDIETAQAGLQGSEQAVSKANALADELVANVKKQAAFKFVMDKGNITGATMQPEVVFNQIFSNLDDTASLMKRVKEESVPGVGRNQQGNPMVLAGIQAQYLRFLKDEIFTAKRLGADSTTGGTVQGLSLSKLQDILGGSDNMTTRTLHEVFFDQPDFAYDLEALFSVMENDLGIKASRADPFGSNTQIDNERLNAAKTLVAVVVGPLTRIGTTVNALVRAGTQPGMMEVAENIKIILSKAMVDTKWLTKTLDDLSAAGNDPSKVTAILRGLRDTAKVSDAGVDKTSEDDTEAALMPTEDKPSLDIPWNK